MNEKRKLCRSMSDKAIFGVCSGFAKYFDIDPIVIRLAVVLLALMGTLGLWFYILAAIIMPKDTDFVFTQQPRYDTETGRPLYEAGGTVYENRAAGMNTQAAPVQDAEFTSTPYSYTETVRSTETQENTEGVANDEAPEASESSVNAEASNASESCADSPEIGDVGGFWTDPNKETQSSQSSSYAQAANEQPKQDPYKNFQGYQSASQQADKSYQASRTQPKPESRSGRSSRNTGILLIIIGVVILAKIVLPKINIWIPISIALIFFGIYLCCRKK